MEKIERTFDNLSVLKIGLIERVFDIFQDARMDSF